MTFAQLIEHPKGSVFLKDSADNEAGKLVPDHFLLFEKVFC